jgi:hypothetical protein
MRESATLKTDLDLQSFAFGLMGRFLDEEPVAAATLLLMVAVNEGFVTTEEARQIGEAARYDPFTVNEALADLMEQRSLMSRTDVEFFLGRPSR